MERILIKELKDKIGQEVRLQGRVLNIRELGGVTFVLVQDYTGAVQTVWDKPVKVGVSDAVELTGKVKKDERAQGGLEVHGQELKVVSSCEEELPFDLAKKELKLQLPTLLDHRALSLRHPKTQAIFLLYDLLLKQYELVMREEGFVEVKTPKILGAASEGGANFFKINYFEQEAYLAQSPQLYKQIMAGVFERVFEIGSTFRAEPSFTTRHMTEYISLDAEMAFIEDMGEIMDTLARVLKKMFERLAKEGAEHLKALDIEVPKVPEKIPTYKLDEIKKIIKEKYDYEVPKRTDIDPEGERLSGRYAKEKHQSDFIYLTHYPWDERPFYHLPTDGKTETTDSFDLIFRGVELVTGSQRIHCYDELMESMKKKGVKAKGLEFYLDIFKFGVPPHGGWGMGSERLLQQLLGLKSVKEATLFPRDVKRLSP